MTHSPIDILEKHKGRTVVVSLYLGHMAGPDNLTVLGWHEEWLHVRHKKGNETYYQWRNIIAFSVDSIT